ncbi:hypothetical protein PAAG_06482 [Paracoccidioides lutzii Pb01]|uniref:Uncharacterized protein n=1 Tax=Paracoccidioides lutzii (strain ATCC MYA-826 / Pb01) TaxID=502779 RepID=C1H6U1_PARBA|nr:hypothetical protein PAAG_06482 [Paracoccidioides lutzii Pb01]EEH35435.2 hypothetical protein PAAG_06482 [Paracoccidioides lutzii Pb01]
MLRPTGPLKLPETLAAKSICSPEVPLVEAAAGGEIKAGARACGKKSSLGTMAPENVELFVHYSSVLRTSISFKFGNAKRVGSVHHAVASFLAAACVETGAGVKTHILLCPLCFGLRGEERLCAQQTFLNQKVFFSRETTLD